MAVLNGIRDLPETTEKYAIQVTREGLNFEVLIKYSTLQQVQPLKLIAGNGGSQRTFQVIISVASDDIVSLYLSNRQCPESVILNPVLSLSIPTLSIFRV